MYGMEIGNFAVTKARPCLSDNFVANAVSMQLERA